MAGSKKKNTLAGYTTQVGRKKPPAELRQTKTGTLLVKNEEILFSLASDGVGGFTAWGGLNPAGGLFNWARGIASRYSRFRFKHLSLSFASAGNSFTNGQIAMAIFYDYQDAINWNSSGGDFARLVASEGSVTGPLYGQTFSNGRSSMCVDVHTGTLWDRTKWCTSSQPSSFTSSPADIAFNNQSVAAFVGVKVIGADFDKGLGTIVASYEIEFAGPVGNANSPSLVYAACPPPAWWVGSSEGWAEFVAQNPRFCPTRPLPPPKPTEPAVDAGQE